MRALPSRARMVHDPRMQSRWSDAHAREFVARYAAHGEDLALRVYTSRLIGEDADLVLHGGGNTSVKTMQSDALGRSVRCLCVKGSCTRGASDSITPQPAMICGKGLSRRARGTSYSHVPIPASPR
jgi:hypothetical protein